MRKRKTAEKGQEACYPAPLRITGAVVKKTMTIRKLEFPEAVSWLISEWHRSHTPEAAMAIWRKAINHARHTASVSRPIGMAYEEAREFLENYLTKIIVRWYCGELPQYPNVESAYFAHAVHSGVKLHRAWMSSGWHSRAELEDWIYDLVPDGRPDATAEDELIDEIPEGPAREAAKLLLHGIPADSLADHIGKRAARKAIDYLREFLVRRRLPTGAFPKRPRSPLSIRNYVVDGDYDHPMRCMDAAAIIGVTARRIREIVNHGQTEIHGHSVVRLGVVVGRKDFVHSLARPVVRIDANGIEKTYESIAAAARDIGTNPGHISLVCNGKRRTAAGYRWCWLEEFTEEYKSEVLQTPSKPRPQPGKPVARIDADGAETKYESLKAAAMGTPGAYSYHIANVCNGKRHTAAGYRWRWLTDNKRSKRSKCNHQHNNQKRPVVRIGQDGVETRFDSLLAASRATAVSLGHIWMVCQGTRHTAAGYRWRWLEEPE